MLLHLHRKQQHCSLSASRAHMFVTDNIWQNSRFRHTSSTVARSFGSIVNILSSRSTCSHHKISLSERATQHIITSSRENCFGISNLPSFSDWTANRKVTKLNESKLGKNSQSSHATVASTNGKAPPTCSQTLKEQAMDPSEVP